VLHAHLEVLQPSLVVSVENNDTANLLATDRKFAHKLRQVRMAGDLKKCGEAERVEHSAEVLEESGAEGYEGMAPERATHLAHSEKCVLISLGKVPKDSLDELWRQVEDSRGSSRLLCTGCGSSASVENHGRRWSECSVSRECKSERDMCEKLREDCKESLFVVIFSAKLFTVLFHFSRLEICAVLLS
jgi:hypothetical protein